MASSYRCHDYSFKLVMFSKTFPYFSQEANIRLVIISFSISVQLFSDSRFSIRQKSRD